jgi:hypothetical protein
MIEAQVKEALGWYKRDFCDFHHAYNNFQFEAGLRYLEDEMDLDTVSVSKMAQNRHFWGWWRNQWVKRDKTFLNDVARFDKDNLPKTIYSFKNICYTYKQYHNTNAILFVPHKELLRKSYAQFIGKFTKQIINE